MGIAGFGVLAGCSGAGSDTIVFEVNYFNSGWPTQSRGYYVTLGGDLYQYDYYDAHPRTETPPERSEQMTPDDIRQLHGNSAHRMATIPDSEVTGYVGGLEDAWRDGVALQRVPCSDSGRWSYYGYHDLGDGTFGTVLLAYAGNTAGLNLAPPAAGMVSWLKEVTRTGAECPFTTGSCDEESCSKDAPSCSVSVSGIGLDSTHCPVVDDCLACLEGACIVDAAGDKHCSAAEECDGERPVCAAGGAWCSGDARNGMSCTQP